MWWLIIQGPMQNYRTVKKFLNGYENVIWSGWKSDATVLSSEKHVVINDPPTTAGPGNLNYQLISTLGGLKYAKNLGIKNVLKIRSDMALLDLQKFLTILKEDQLNFLCCHENENRPYLLDYVFAGSVDVFLDVFNDCFENETFDMMYGNQFAEARITSSILKKTDREQLKNINFFLFDLNSDIDIYWLKKQIYLTSYKIEACYNKHKTFPILLR